MAQPSTWSIYQYNLRENSLPAYFCFRPPIKTPWQLPAALVNVIFARCLDRIRSPVASLGECEAAGMCAQQLVDAMARYYQTESDRQQAVLQILEEFLGFLPASFSFQGADLKRRAHVGVHPTAPLF